MRTSSTGLSPEKVQLCKMCILVLRDILHLAEKQGTNSRQKTAVCVCGKQFCFTANIQQHQKQHVGEKSCQYDMGRPTLKKKIFFYLAVLGLSCDT